jgi:hypothetical protein
VSLQGTAIDESSGALILISNGCVGRVAARKSEGGDHEPGRISHRPDRSRAILSQAR